MLAWLVIYLTALSGNPEPLSEAGKAGAVIGGGIAIMFLFIVWGGGAVVLGFFALLTRGSKTIVEEIER